MPSARPLRRAPRSSYAIAEDGRRRRAAGRAADTATYRSSSSRQLTGRCASGTSASGRSQSPSVESATCRTPAEASIRTSPRRSSAAAAANRSRSFGRSCRREAAGRSRDRRAAARRRRRAPARADRGSRPQASGAVRRRGAAAGASRSGRGSPRRSRRASAGPASPSTSVERVAERAVARAARSRSAASVSSSPRRPWRGVRHGGSSRPEGDEPEPVAAPGRRMADRERDALGDVGFPPLGGPERHRRRGVVDEPGDEHALGELDADVRLARARGDVPVDPADVVARLVRPDLVQLAAEPGEGRAVVARQQPVDAPSDRELERLEALGRDRARGRAAPGSAPRSVAARSPFTPPQAARPRSSWGGWTCASTSSAPCRPRPPRRVPGRRGRAGGGRRRGRAPRRRSAGRSRAREAPRARVRRRSR